MGFAELIHRRRSVRSYTPDPVEPEKLQSVLDAARLAPTAANLQPFRLIVIHTAGREADLRRIYRSPWLARAPIVICICTLPAEGWSRMDGKPYADVDAAIVMDHLVLAATEQGLGTCWIAAFDPKAAREVLGLPEGVEPLAFTPLGYPADRPSPRDRKLLEELVRYERW